MDTSEIIAGIYERFDAQLKQLMRIANALEDNGDVVEEEPKLDTARAGGYIVLRMSSISDLIRESIRATLVAHRAVLVEAGTGDQIDNTNLVREMAKNAAQVLVMSDRGAKP